jgi:hypothetical protein
MNEKINSPLLLIGGIAGIISVISYIIAIMAELPTVAAFLLAMAWPMLSILFSYVLYCLIAAEQQGTANRISFILAVIAFAIVAEMITVQLAVRLGVEEYLLKETADRNLLGTVMKVTRLVDMGLDVTWDIFIGASLMVMAFPMAKHSRLKLWWAAPSFMLGAALIILNTITFPFPPDSRGLFDIGPLIGLYIIALSIRLLSITSLYKKTGG